ncbi:MAG: hypothetical protein ACM3US_06885 [Sphingomonadaceae bacterium]
MVRLPRIRSRAGQLTWLQVLSLAISGVFFVNGDQLPAMVMLVLATLFGVTAAIRRVRDAQRTHPELFQKKRRR